ncbi:MAG TPA: helix-turn-helix transcriptional regulator [Acidothermaceae bacterium]|jgi:MerR family transcriptional regulator/heat shock protein HspR|nr:helix-turn-helix transcriptional regulator [Acidothermaceae bacterium]
MHDETNPVFVISVAAELSGLHPQTLRTYDKLGLVSPDRAVGRGRRYSSRDISQLREVQRLSQEHGVNLAGIKRILELENQVSALRQRLAELSHELESVHASAVRQVAEAHASHRRDLVPISQMRAALIWSSEVAGPRLGGDGGRRP